MDQKGQTCPLNPGKSPPATSRQPVSFCVTAPITATCLCSVHRWVPPLASDLYSCSQASTRHCKAFKRVIFQKKKHTNNTDGSLGLVYFKINAKNGSIYEVTS